MPNLSQMPDPASGTHEVPNEYLERVWYLGGVAPKHQERGREKFGCFNCHLGCRNLLISLQGARSCFWVGSWGTEFSLQGGRGVGALARSVGSRCELHVSELVSLSMASGGAHTALSLGHP